MRYLSVQDYASEQGVTTQSVYARIKRGTLQTISKRVDNKDTTFIVVDLDDCEDNNIVKGVDNIAEQNKPLQNHAMTDTRLLDFMDEVKEYMLLAGQTKLLMDSENRTRQEYFQVVQENATLKAKNEALQEKLKAIEEKQNISWFKKL